jgi:putative oxidoreductase
MHSKLWLVNMGFIPRSYDVALLFLRVALGISMMVLHGWEKLTGFRVVVENFPDPIGIGRHLSLLLALFAELACSALLVVGALTRFAATILVINMSVALFLVHRGDMTTGGGGEPAALYLYGYIAILLAGAGRFSADGAGGPWALATFGAVAGLLAGYPLSFIFQPADHAFVRSMGDYLANIRGVLADPDLKTRAVGVWIACVVLFALAGWLIGYAMYRRRREVVTVETPPPPPAD